MKTPQATYGEDEDNDGGDGSNGSVGGGSNYSSRHIFSATMNIGIGC